MEINELYKKDAELRRRINSFLMETFELPAIDYYGKLDLDELLRMKSALSDIHNTISMRLTLSFVTWVSKILSLDIESTRAIRGSVLSTKPNRNGFDVYWEGAPTPFVAEVKCNIPINGKSKFGSAQAIGIVKDINALMNGKTKAAPLPPETLRFMVFLDHGQVRNAIKHIQESSKMPKNFRLLTSEASSEALNPDLVYGICLGLDS